jgi:hypothetical protein
MFANDDRRAVIRLQADAHEGADVLSGHICFLDGVSEVERGWPRAERIELAGQLGKSAG